MIRSLLITAASLAAFVIPAGADALDKSPSAVAVHSGSPSGDQQWRGRGFPSGVSASGSGCDNRRAGGRHGGQSGDRLGCSGYGGFWGYYSSNINRSWDSDSYNDWWHDRPDRAFPRWVQQQRDEACAPDRMWWSGSGWHC